MKSEIPFKKNLLIWTKGETQLNQTAPAQSIIYGMGTVISSKVFGEQAKEALKAAEEEVVRLEGLLSRFLPESEISRINNSAGICYEKISSETYEVLLRADEYSKCCPGCFDVTVAPLIDLWRNARGTAKPPDKSVIKRILSQVDYTNLIINPCEKAVFLKSAGQFLDLGGIGKGFAADLILKVFKKYEVSSAFTNFGGNVAAIGTKPDGSPWRIGIQHPRNENSIIGVVAIVNQSVVTSGDYQQYFIGNNNKRYHHILNPSTGYPSESGLVSATIIADSSVAADALSTILFIAGMNKGIELLKSFPETEAILIDKDLQVYITQGLKECFQTVERVKINILDPII
jgi:thiamine biosynthesis lipoprotein